MPDLKRSVESVHPLMIRRSRICRENSHKIDSTCTHLQETFLCPHLLRLRENEFGYHEVQSIGSYRFTQLAGNMKTQLYVPNSEKELIGGQLRKYRYDIENSNGTCLFVCRDSGSMCEAPVSRRCHSIPKAAVVSELTNGTDGMVFEFRWGVGPWLDIRMRSGASNPVDLFSSQTFRPVSVGVGDASTGRFACGAHDSHFTEIDVVQHDKLNQKKAILNAYRILLYSADQSRRYMGKSFDPRLRPKIMRSNSRNLRMEFIKHQEAARGTFPILAGRIHRVSSLWLRNEQLPDETVRSMGVKRFTFRSKLRFAASIMSEVNGCFFIVVPGSDDSHTLHVTYFLEDADSLAVDIEVISKLTRDTLDQYRSGIEVFQFLYSRSFGSIVASRLSYNNLNNIERHIIRGLIRDGSGVEALSRIFSDKINFDSVNQAPRNKNWRWRRNRFPRN